MADRKVSASLTLEARQFHAEAKSAIDELKKLAKSGEVSDEALRQMQSATDKAGASLLRLAADGRLTAAELKKADDKVDELRGSLMELGGATHLAGADAQVKLLEAEIDAAKRKMAELSAEFRRTGSASSLAGFKDAEASLKKLEGTLGEVERVMGGQGQQGLFAKLSAGINSGVESGLANGFEMSLTNPYVLGAIAVAAPVLGAMVGGALLTGIGLAGIGAGIAGQIHDPRVMAAAGRLGKDVSAGFKDATASFAAPLHDALVGFDDEWKNLQPGLKSTFNELSPLVGKLSEGAAGFVDKLVPGLEKAAVAAKPLVSDFSNWLPKLGAELGDVFTTMAKHSTEAREGLAALTQGVDLLAGSLQFTIPLMAYFFKYSGLGEFENMVAGGDKLGKTFVNLGIALSDMDRNLPRTAADFAALQQKFTTMQPSIDTLAQSMTDAVIGAEMGMDRANIAVAASLNSVSDALKKNKDQLDIHKAAGEADRTVVLDAVQANVQQYDAMIQSGIGADDATAAYEANTRALEDQMRKAGLTQAQIDGLIGKYKNVPKNVNTALAVKGLTDSINNLVDLIYLLNHIPKYKSTVYEIDYHEHSSGEHQSSTYNPPSGKGGHPAGNRYGGIQHFAGGGMFAAGSAGIVSGGGPYAMFGEPGTGAQTEGFLPRSGAHNPGGLLSTMAGWYGYRLAGAGGRGGDGAAIQVAITVRDDAGRMLDVINTEVQRRGGNVQAVLGGRR